MVRGGGEGGRGGEGQNLWLARGGEQIQNFLINTGSSTNSRNSMVMYERFQWNFSLKWVQGSLLRPSHAMQLFQDAIRDHGLEDLVLMVKFSLGFKGNLD